MHFLKTRHEYDEDGLTIKMGAKYIEKLVQLLGLQNKKARTTPELALEEDGSAELQGEKRGNFATAVGIYIYIYISAQTGQTHNIASVSSQANWESRQKGITNSSNIVI